MARMLAIGCVVCLALVLSACSGGPPAHPPVVKAPTHVAAAPHKRRPKPHLRRRFHKSPRRQLQPWTSVHCRPHRPCHHRRYLGGIFEGDEISEDILQMRRGPFLQVFGPPKPVAPKDRRHDCIYYDDVNRNGRTDGWGWEFCFNRRGRMTEAGGLAPDVNPPAAS